MQEHYLYDVAAIDVEDLRALMEHYGEDVWKYAYFLTGDPHLADDIAQETFIRAYRSFHTFRRESSVKSWLLKITRNTAFTAQRRAFLRKAVLLDSRSPDGSPLSLQDIGRLLLLKKPSSPMKRKQNYGK